MWQNTRYQSTSGHRSLRLLRHHESLFLPHLFLVCPPGNLEVEPPNNFGTADERSTNLPEFFTAVVRDTHTWTAAPGRGYPSTRHEGIGNDGRLK